MSSHAGSPPAATGANAQQKLAARVASGAHLDAPQLWCIGGPGERQARQAIVASLSKASEPAAAQQPSSSQCPLKSTQVSISHQPLLLPLHPPKSSISTQISCAGLPKLKRALLGPAPASCPSAQPPVGTRYSSLSFAKYSWSLFSLLVITVVVE